MLERLSKVLARAGVASRRGAEKLLAEGRVTVNGAVAREPGVRVDMERDAIKLDGRRLGAPPRAHTYLMLNKPRGYVTTLSDPQQRPTVRDLLRGVRARVYPVGRLDYHSEGLLLLTDDGDLARDLMHPRSGVKKTYRAKVRGRPVAASLERLRRGVVVEGRRTLPAEARLVGTGANAWLEVTVVEGRKHQVRRMLDAIGHPVQKLRRVRFDGLVLGRLAPGAMRRLTPGEVARLKHSVASSGEAKRPRQDAPRSV